MNKNPTMRQTEILGYVANGKTSEEIAKLLHLAKKTVDNHINDVCKRLGVGSRVEAVVVCLAVGWISFPPDVRVYCRYCGRSYSGEAHRSAPTAY